MNKLVLTARAEGRNKRHALIGVFQNGAKAGVLTVDAEQEHTVINLINGAPKLLATVKAIAEGRSFSDNEVERAIRDRCRAAIKKAEGGRKGTEGN